MKVGEIETVKDEGFWDCICTDMGSTGSLSSPVSTTNINASDQCNHTCYGCVICLGFNVFFVLHLSYQMIYFILCILLFVRMTFCSYVVPS